MRIATIILLSVASIGAGQDRQDIDAQLRNKARELSRKLIIIDTHQDTPYRLEHSDEDISKRTARGHFDYPRAKEGGLDVVFMAVYVPPSLEDKGTAHAFADKTIDAIEGLAQNHPAQFVLARSIEDIKHQFGTGPVSIALGIENGAPLAGDLANLKHFYDRGVRYITLCHSKSNHICDSSYDETRRWHGLSPFGVQLVGAMNRLGMIVDISHVSDEAFYQVMEHSRAPVVATHSGCRHFTPGWERNMDDDMIRLLAEKGGLIHINFGSIFASAEVFRKRAENRNYVAEHVEAHHLEGEARSAFVRQYYAEHPIGRGDVSEVAEQIDYVVKLVGVDHVGLGSDFDGVSSVPQGLTDVSCYPNLIYELLKRGYTEEAIEKICAGNFLRVWAAIQKAAS